MRTLRIWTWDYGHREIDADGDPRLIAQVLQTVLDGGLWNQFEKFPADCLERALPYLSLASHTRRLVEIRVEEARRPAA
jgi:hypothetical protein